MTKHCNEVHPLFMIPPATSSHQWPTSLCHFNFVHGPPSAPGLLEHAFISRRTDGCWCQWLWRCSDHCQVCHHFRVHTGVVWESDRLESELICRFFEPPSPAGRGDSGCSASPKGTCSSYGRSGCTLPIQLKEDEDRGHRERQWISINSLCYTEYLSMTLCISMVNKTNLLWVYLWFLFPF